jgi:hypothetical protein
MDFAAAHADMRRSIFMLPVGLRVFHSGRARVGSLELWEKRLRDCGQPVRTDNGLLTLECEGDTYAYADGVRVLKWLNAARSRGFQGVVLSPAEDTPSDFWRWVDMQRGPL